MKFLRAAFIQLILLPAATALFAQDPLHDIRISIRSSQGTLGEVLEEISLQTGLHFTYNAAYIDRNRITDIVMEDAPLDIVLDSIFSDPALAVKLIDRNIVVYKINETPPLPVVPAIDRSLVSGRVEDARSGKSIAYATIALQGSPVGTISNQRGEYVLKIPPGSLNPILSVSHLGYKRELRSLVQADTGAMVIRMERESIPLQEVVIRRVAPERVLAEAIERIPGNYLQESSTVTAYYRESVRRNKHFMVFSEAVLEGAKGPYTPLSPPDRVRIRKGRKIMDTTTSDTVLVKLRSGIYDAFLLDIVKNPPDFLSAGFSELYDLALEDMMVYGDRLVYVIGFRQKEHITGLMFRGQLYIDHESMAILAADFEYNPELIHQEPGLFLVSSSPRIRIRPIQARYHVEYKKLQDTYLVHQVRAELEMKVRKKRNWIASRYSISIEMAVTDAVPGKTIRIDRNERVRANAILAEQDFEFDPQFWGPFNIIKPEASLKESLQRIQEKLKFTE